MKYLFKNNGAALSIVILVLLVLSVIGIAILNVSLSDTKQGIYQEEHTKAYHVAKSGIDVAVQRIENEITAHPAQYVIIDDIAFMFQSFSGTLNSTYSGTYDISFIDNGLMLEEKIKILANSNVNNADETVALTVPVASPYLNPKGWINNGWIVNDGSFSSNTPVIFRTLKNIQHVVMKTSNAAPTTFKAPSIYFLDTAKGSSLEVTKNSETFTLESNFVYLKNKMITENDDTAELYLKVLDNGQGLLEATLNTPLIATHEPTFKDNDGADILTGYGVIYLPGLATGSAQNPNMVDVITTEDGDGSDPLALDSPSGYYFFKGIGVDLNLDNPDHRIAYGLLPITDPDVVDYLDDLVKKETSLQILINEGVWSRN